jgi:L-cysteine:1D-myo-inositol 2-amino-2-deoxy-alpha-D-glucopyranoside ligase
LAIRLRDRRTGKLHRFQPGVGETSIYICGVTPYDAAHLGHIATFLTYDVLTRRLHDLGHRTKVVRNITDLDDPIIERAAKIGVGYDDLVESEIRQLKSDLSELNFLPPDHEPRVSEYLPEVIEFITELQSGGHTYQVGDKLYFDVSTSADFGSTAGYSRDLMLHYARERGGTPDDPSLRNPFDFLLWRPSHPGEPVHRGPWGPGMPGWHIGCSAMARRLLGQTIDLHGGGVDLVFPHHECEIAQTSAVQTATFVRTWQHCEFVSYQGEKMSKSLGNVVLVRDLLARHRPGAIRLAILRQYRYAVGFEWRDEDIDRGEQLLDLLETAAAATAGPAPEPWSERVRAALDDDLDFPSAVAGLADLARAVVSSSGSDPRAPKVVQELAGLLGVELNRPEQVTP